MSTCSHGEGRTSAASHSRMLCGSRRSEASHAGGASETYDRKPNVPPQDGARSNGSLSGFRGHHSDRHSTNQFAGPLLHPPMSAPAAHALRQCPDARRSARPCGGGSAGSDAAARPNCPGGARGGGGVATAAGASGDGGLCRVPAGPGGVQNHARPARPANRPPEPVLARRPRTARPILGQPQRGCPMPRQRRPGRAAAPAPRRLAPAGPRRPRRAVSPAPRSLPPRSGSPCWPGFR